MLLDSNIIIYASEPKRQALRDWIAANATAVSAVSYVEVLGYHKLSSNERSFYEQFFAIALILPIESDVLDTAVKLRQMKRMTLGDALIAATALVHQLTLVTHNTSDFDWIVDLSLIDPLRRDG
jgi:toxin FitB